MIPNGLLPLNSFEKGCIVNVTDPTPSEIGTLKTALKVPDDFLTDILDVDERSRMEVEDDMLLMIYRIPYQNQSNGFPFTTIPLGLVLTKEHLVIICHRNNEVLDDFFSRSGKSTSSWSPSWKPWKRQTCTIQGTSLACRTTGSPGRSPGCGGSRWTGDGLP